MFTTLCTKILSTNNTRIFLYITYTLSSCLTVSINLIFVYKSILDMISLTSLVICAIIAFVIFRFLSRPKSKSGSGRPIPGPFQLPFLGNLIQLGKLPHIKLTEWAAKYGKIYQVGFGPYQCIVLSDAKLIKEAFNEAALSGRVDLESFHIFAGGKHGVISSDGQEWIEQRRFTLRNLRDFGFGRNTMENLINEEVIEYLEFLKKNEDQGVSVVERFSLAVLNSLWTIIANKRYKQDDPKLMEIFEKNKTMAAELSNSPAVMLPSLAKLVPELSGWNKLVDFLESTKQLSRSHINEHKQAGPQHDDELPRDFIDAYLREMKSTTDPTSSFYKDKGEASLLAVIQDLFFAGSETTAFTLTWAVLYLSKFPRAQKKMQDELDTVIGKNRRPSLADRPQLPYTEAVIVEIMRMSTIAPIGVFHTAMTDLNFNGYHIQKGTWLLPNQHCLHYSKDIWEEPQDFRPERHLTADGKGVTKHEAFMPFSTGKRVCVGQSLALDTTYLFLTSIFQKYELRLEKDVTLDPKPGFTLCPVDFRVLLKERL